MMSDIRKDSAVIKRYFCEDVCGTGSDKIICGMILSFAKPPHTYCFRESLQKSSDWKTITYS